MSTPPASSDTPISVPSAPVTFFKRSAKTKSSIRKRAATPPPPNSDESDYTSASETESPKRSLKKRRNLNRKALVTSEPLTKKPTRDELPVARTYTSDTRTLTSANDATKTNWHNEINGYEPPSKPLPSSADDESPVPGLSGAYKGASSYGNFLKKSENAPPRTVGPMKAPSNIRSITVTDYAPDVCKDYKQTGFCGFGDTCKFLHAREDYAQGWKLDRDWEISQKSGKVKKQEDDADDDEWKELKDIPFACVICKNDYKLPIVTKCTHYFCESCAIARYRKNPGCAICGKRTDGVFNVAKGLRKKLDRKRQREEERKKEEDDAKED